MSALHVARIAPDRGADMCRFCIEHGEGERWYLQAANYAVDLESDLRRRDYVVGFIRDFQKNRTKAIRGLGLLRAAPQPLREAGRERVIAGFREHHFGQPVPIEEVERILDITTSITRIPCVCRIAADTTDDRYCVVVTTRPIDDVLAEAFRDYANGPDLSDFHRISQEEALAFMRSCEERGLMHSVWTFITPFIAAICNCDLKSGCMAMRITREFETPIMLKGHDVAIVDTHACTGCAGCVRLCPFEAITHDRAGRIVSIDPDACYGCGICRSACTEGALSLRDRGTVAITT